MLRLIERQQGRPLAPAGQVNGTGQHPGATPDAARRDAATKGATAKGATAKGATAKGEAATGARKPQRASAARLERGRTAARGRS
jgi:hypothetical protein